ncbi:hypothetical protein KP509_17G081600 [Ceratopteris richardii]|uniref:Uncharacterized protein n=1 Tax=Ceratopteris richardii TaxID=49495 RepID=A0A8T2SW03_CERRI|nr:hypothetical protein KP509_17G081600 [Ceratopteris richardii]
MAMQTMVTAMLFVAVAVAGYAEGSSTIINESAHAVIAEPTADVNATVLINAGANVTLVGDQLESFFQNLQTGNQAGPVALSDGSTYVIVNADVDAQVNIRIASLVNGVLHLGATILSYI